MTASGKAAADKMVSLLKGPQGLNDNLAAMSLPIIHDRQIMAQNVSLELAEKSGEARYPAVHVYCEKVHNEMREKFRAFSGRAAVAIELRVSQDRLEGIEQNLQACTDAITQVLEQSRGDWGNGLYYGGAYDVTFAPVKHGGRNLIQVAKIALEVGISRVNYLCFSNANRFYTALEASYGQVPEIGAQNRIPAVKLKIRQQVETAQRRDKTGSRTFAGLPAGLRRQTTFDLKTYMTSWAGRGQFACVWTAVPGRAWRYATWFRAEVLRHRDDADAGGIRGAARPDSGPGGKFCTDEIRFVSAIVNSTTVKLNAPFSAPPAAGSPLGPTVTYPAASDAAERPAFSTTGRLQLRCSECCAEPR